MPASQQQPDSTIVPLDELQKLIKEAESSGAQAVAQAGYRIKLCVTAGKALLHYRSNVGHGGWLSWVEENLEDITPQTALKWIKLWQAVDSGKFNPDDAKSVRHAYILAGILPEPDENPSHNPPAETNYLVHLDRFESAMRSIDVAKLATDERQQLQQRLKPAAELYATLATM